MAGARERKRAERRKRKRRSEEGSAPPIEPQPAPPSDANGAASRSETFQERMARRYEERNVEARAKLEPLDPGERPRAVTVAAVVSVLLALLFSVSAVLAFAGVHAGGRDIKPAPIVLFAFVFWAMAVGLRRSRYWAVLGFQTVLLLMMLASAVGLIAVTTALQAVGTTLLLLGSGTLFYFMIRAMARIQMPSPPGE
jgi:hypothetical protein